MKLESWALPCVTIRLSGPFYTYRQIHFTGGNALLCDICMSVCLSVTYLSFTQYWNLVERLYFSEKLPLTLVNGGVILRSNAQRSMSLRKNFPKKM